VYWRGVRGLRVRPRGRPIPTEAEPSLERALALVQIGIACPQDAGAIVRRVVSGKILARTVDPLSRGQDEVDKEDEVPGAFTG